MFLQRSLLVQLPLFKKFINGTRKRDISLTDIEKYRRKMLKEKYFQKH